MHLIAIKIVIFLVLEGWLALKCTYMPKFIKFLPCDWLDS